MIETVDFGVLEMQMSHASENVIVGGLATLATFRTIVAVALAPGFTDPSEQAICPKELPQPASLPTGWNVVTESGIFTISVTPFPVYGPVLETVTT